MMTPDSEPRGRIVRTWKDGLPILWTHVPALPPPEVRDAMPWLTVVRWAYDGAGENGMPDDETNRRMLVLEAVLDDVERSGYCVEGYRRIGAGVREYVHYAADRDAFLQAFNRRTAGDPPCPITITFYRDDAWSDLQTLIDDVGQAGTTGLAAPSS